MSFITVDANDSIQTSILNGFINKIGKTVKNKDHQN